MSEWLVEFKLFGAFAGQAAAAQAGVRDARTWEAGDPLLSGALLKYTRGGFSIASSLPRTAGLVDHVDDVLSQLREPAAIKRIAPPPERVELSCALYLAPGERPEIGLRPDQLAALALLGAAFDIDLYPDYLTQ